MAKVSSKEKTASPAPITDPKTAEDFLSRGWNHYSKKEFFRAESDFRQALELSPDNVENLYGLALSLQASGRSVDAVQTFEQTILILEQAPDTERVRANMLARLSRGHINRIKTGDWNLNAK